MEHTMADTNTGPIWNEWSATDITEAFGKIAALIHDINHHQISDEHLEPRSADPAEQLDELRFLAQRLIVTGAHALEDADRIRDLAEQRRWILTAEDRWLRLRYRQLPWDGSTNRSEQTRSDIEDEWVRRGYPLDSLDEE
jgi:hypothetical protein